MEALAHAEWHMNAQEPRGCSYDCDAGTYDPRPITCEECGAEDIEFLPHAEGCQNV
jgi:hypothetical protein